MRTFEIELKRVSYVTLQIDANTPEEAEALAWREIESDSAYDRYGEWTHECTTEQVEAC